MVLKHLQRCDPVLSNGNNGAPGVFSEQSVLNCIHSADPDKMRALAEKSPQGDGAGGFGLGKVQLMQA